MSFLFVSLGLFAQKITVKGVVNDATGEPVIGANIIIKGTSVGTITDFDGNFTLNANAKDVLVVSFIGYKNAEVKVKPNMVITLRDDTQLLDDVVVIGYGAVKKKELTGAVAQVKSEELTKINTSDLGNALQGMVSGVSVTAESGAPGASSNILIRGVTSVSGGNTPLYVVDGVPQEGDPRISPNEVETIDILKDAASCAIYGTRGAAGVILITTKKGSAGAMKVTFDGSFGVKKIVSNDFLMNASEQNYFEIIRNRALKPDLLDDQVILDLYKVPGYFHNNTNLLDQIFIDNAINYSLPKSEVSLDATVFKNTLVFSIIDHGTGIADKDKPFIFDRFFCADKSRTQKEHYGLGLSIAKELVEMHKGKIELSDTLGGGCTFKIFLPL